MGVRVAMLLISNVPSNKALQLTLDPAKAFAVAKPSSASSATELRR